MIYMMVFAGSMFLNSYSFVSLHACNQGVVYMKTQNAQAYCVREGEE